MRRLEAVQGPLGGLSLRALRREIDDLLPRLLGAREILLAERPDDALVQQRLRMFRVDFQRFVELLERSIVTSANRS